MQLVIRNYSNTLSVVVDLVVCNIVVLLINLHLVIYSGFMF